MTMVTNASPKAGAKPNRQQRRQAARLAKQKGRRGNGAAAPADGTLQEAVKLHKAGHSHEALQIYRKILAVQPDQVDALNLSGVANLELSHFGEAVKLLQAAVRLQPRYAEAHNNLGNALQAAGRLDEAAAAYRRATGIKPDYAEAHYNLGILLQKSSDIAGAMAAYRRAVESNPSFAKAYNSLAAMLREFGELDEAIEAYKNVLTLKPSFSGAHSNLILAMNLHSRFAAEDILAESRHWDEIHALPHAVRARPHANTRDPERRLRVGYVSPDFWCHSVSYFVEPLLANHDRNAVEVFCYAEVARPDEVTARLQTLADGWRSTVGLSDAEVADRIREDRIDILVDLAGHTPNNRLLAFAGRPAPVQVSWLGYGATTGMTAMDYRLSDAVVDPVDEGGVSYSETLIRLPHAFFCYSPPTAAPDVAPPPAHSNGYVTFGTFNNSTKVGPGAVEVWAQVLRETPGSRLLMKSDQFRDEALRRKFLDAFLSHGIDGERIEFMPKIPAMSGHLRAHGRLDIALDPFPYNGGTTSLEAAWMGVPMIALRGDRFFSRMGASILAQLGLTDLVAETAEDYVERAVALARNTEHLAGLRWQLRPRMLASPLCDAQTFARDIEAAYRDMWRRWCGKEAGDG